MGVAPRQQKKDISRMLTDDEKRRLDEVFYGGGVLMRRYDQFRDKAKALGLSDDKLKYYYENQELVQLFKPIVKPKLYIPISATYPMERVYFDTMVITPLNLTLINAVDLFSKYGFVKVYRGQSSDSVKATKALDAIIEEGYIPSSVRVDDGTEFYGSFAKTCKDLGIDLVHLEAGDKKKTSPIEAFNRTMRLAIEKVRSTLSDGNPVQSQMEKAIREIVDNYNKSVHSSTKATPYDVLHNKAVADEVMVRNVLNKKEKMEKLQSGSGETSRFEGKVRLAVKGGVFTKLSPNWTKELYQIKGFDEGKNRYLIEGKRRSYERWEIQPVDDRSLMRKKIERWVVHSGKADDLERKTGAQKRAEKELKTDLIDATASGKRIRKVVDRLNL